MKKFILMLAAALPMVFTSCGDDNDDALLTLNQTSMNLTYDDEATLTASEKNCTWTSSNPFVATVDQDGKVEAEHVGTAVITATKNGTTAKCEVTVTPKYNYFAMPCLKWDANQETVKADVKGLWLDAANSTATALQYWTNDQYAFPAYQYEFNSKGGLELAELMTELTDKNLENLDDWLDQYYEDVTPENSKYIAEYAAGNQTLVLDFIEDAATGDLLAYGVTWVSPTAVATRSGMNVFDAAKVSMVNMIKNRK